MSGKKYNTKGKGIHAAHYNNKQKDAQEAFDKINPCQKLPASKKDSSIDYLDLMAMWLAMTMAEDSGRGKDLNLIGVSTKDEGFKPTFTIIDEFTPKANELKDKIQGIKNNSQKLLK